MRLQTFRPQDAFQALGEAGAGLRDHQIPLFVAAWLGTGRFNRKEEAHVVRHTL